MELQLWRQLKEDILPLRDIYVKALKMVFTCIVLYSTANSSPKHLTMAPRSPIPFTHTLLLCTALVNLIGSNSVECITQGHIGGLGGSWIWTTTRQLLDKPLYLPSHRRGWVGRSPAGSEQNGPHCLPAWDSVIRVRLGGSNHLMIPGHVTTAAHHFLRGRWVKCGE